MQYRVLHAPSSVGGNPQGLSKALRSLGVDSTSLLVSQNYLAYPADRVLHYPGQNFLIREIKRIITIIFYLKQFDIIHYNSGTTVASAYGFEFSWKDIFSIKASGRYFYSIYLKLLQKLEIYIVESNGIIIFITYQGDDARQGDFSLKNFAHSIAAQVEPGYYSKASDIFKKKNISFLCGKSQEIYALNPDLLYVLPKEAQFLPYSHLDIDEWVPEDDDSADRPIRIVHAPSNRKVKGTDLILATLNELRNAGYNFELVLVEGVSNSEAQKIYRSADILLDQLYAGWYGGLAVELMALGKPVAAYIRETDLKFIPQEMKADLPIMGLHPDTLRSDLENILKMSKNDLHALGRRSRAYIERWHDSKKIAAYIKIRYENSLLEKKR
jgi:hypothetical protein